MDWTHIANTTLDLLAPVLVAAIIALIGYGVTWLKKQTAKIQNETVRGALDGAIIEAQIVGIDAVRATNQVFVDAIKAAPGADGKLTAEEAAAALGKAKDYFVTHISQNSLRVLEAGMGPVKDWVDQFLEAKVGTLKLSATGQKVAAMADPKSSAPAG